jgi:hypothetical protein
MGTFLLFTKKEQTPMTKTVLCESGLMLDDVKADRVSMVVGYAK